MNKQIEEMAKILTKCACECEDDCICSEKEHAEILYNAGYRKQREGEWLTDRFGMERSICSVCGATFEGDGGNFCHHCGAKMKGDGQ